MTIQRFLSSSSSNQNRIFYICLVQEPDVLPALFLAKNERSWEERGFKKLYSRTTHLLNNLIEQTNGIDSRAQSAFVSQQ